MNLSGCVGVSGLFLPGEAVPYPLNRSYRFFFRTYLLKSLAPEGG